MNNKPDPYNSNQHFLNGYVYWSSIKNCAYVVEFQLNYYTRDQEVNLYIPYYYKRRLDETIIPLHIVKNVAEQNY